MLSSWTWGSCDDNVLRKTERADGDDSSATTTTTQLSLSRKARKRQRLPHQDGVLKKIYPVYEKILQKLEASSSFLSQTLRYTVNPVDRDRVDWTHMHPSCDPSGGGIPANRLLKKRQELDNMCWCVERLLARYSTFKKASEIRVVEFCGGSGYTLLPLACRHPEVQFVLVDMKKQSIQIGVERLAASQLQNVTIVQGLVQDYSERFDIGIALHACGEATDLSMEMCLQQRAAFVLCPCCVGKIKHSSLRYPRSRYLRNCITDKDYLFLASAADLNKAITRDEGAQTLHLPKRTTMEEIDAGEAEETEKEAEKSGDDEDMEEKGKESVGRAGASTPLSDSDLPFSVEQKRRRLCKAVVEYDRAKRAQEHGYETYIFLMDPPTCTPKNEIIVGLPPPDAAVTEDGGKVVDRRKALFDYEDVRLAWTDVEILLYHQISLLNI